MDKVTVYTTPTCPWCKKAKEFLKGKKIKYTEKDVSSDRKAQQDMIAKSKQMGVPVLDVNGKIIIGYDPKDIQKALQKRK